MPISHRTPLTFKQEYNVPKNPWETETPIPLPNEDDITDLVNEMYESVFQEPLSDNNFHSANRLTQAHMEVRENKKLYGTTTITNGHIPRGLVLSSLNSRNIPLVPMPIDQFGLIGPMMQKTLLPKRLRNLKYRKSSTRAQKHLADFGKENLQIFNRGKKWQNLMKAADHQWTESHKDTDDYRAWFTPAYQAQLPSQWALNHLSVVIVRMLADHTLRALTKITRPEFQKEEIDITVPAPNHSISNATLSAPIHAAWGKFRD